MSGSYLLVITSRSRVGKCESTLNLPAGTADNIQLVLGHPIYSVKEVVAIPLERSMACDVLGKLNQRNASHLKRHDSLSSFSTINFSDLSSACSDEDGDIEELDPATSETNSLQRCESSMGSTPATVSKKAPSSPAARSLASRLAFWKARGKNRGSTPESEPFPIGDEFPNLTSQNLGLESPQSPAHTIHVNSAPHEVTEIDSKIENSAQLEHRIINQCVQLFSHEMFFSYDFG